jgi:hypothetical protein
MRQCRPAPARSPPSRAGRLCRRPHHPVSSAALLHLLRPRFELRHGSRAWSCGGASGTRATTYFEGQHRAAICNSERKRQEVTCNSPLSCSASSSKAGAHGRAAGRTPGRTAASRAHGRAPDNDGQSTWASGGRSFLVHMMKRRKLLNTSPLEIHIFRSPISKRTNTHLTFSFSNLDRYRWSLIPEHEHRVNWKSSSRFTYSLWNDMDIYEPPDRMTAQ